MNIHPHPFFRLQACAFALLLFGLLNSGCASSVTQNQPAEEIVLYNWEGDIPQSVLDSFTAQSGIKIRYETYESQEDAIENMRAGHVYDVVTMESRFIPLLVREGLLAELDYQNIINFRNISPNFRGLAYDPDNRYSIPYSWGTTGLIVRTDLAKRPITRWSDMWDKRYAGQVAIWVGQPRETLALTLKSLGYSGNSENPVELEDALAHLISLKPNLLFLENFDPNNATPALASGRIVMAMGYSGDFLSSQDAGLQVGYILPEEGALLWGDTFIVPANSTHKTAAELFINFLLDPEISAVIANQKYYATANESALEYINPEILNNSAIFPGGDALKHAEIILPLSADGQQLYNQTWQQFLDAGPK